MSVAVPAPCRMTLGHRRPTDTDHGPLHGHGCACSLRRHDVGENNGLAPRQGSAALLVTRRASALSPIKPKMAASLSQEEVATRNRPDGNLRLPLALVSVGHVAVDVR